MGRPPSTRGRRGGRGILECCIGGRHRMVVPPPRPPGVRRCPRGARPTCAGSSTCGPNRRSGMCRRVASDARSVPRRGPPHPRLVPPSSYGVAIRRRVPSRPSRRGPSAHRRSDATNRVPLPVRESCFAVRPCPCSCTCPRSFLVLPFVHFLHVVHAVLVLLDVPNLRLPGVQERAVPLADRRDQPVELVAAAFHPADEGRDLREFRVVAELMSFRHRPPRPSVSVRPPTRIRRGRWTCRFPL